MLRSGTKSKIDEYVDFMKISVGDFVQIINNEEFEYGEIYSSIDSDGLYDVICFRFNNFDLGCLCHLPLCDLIKISKDEYETALIINS